MDDLQNILFIKQIKFVNLITDTINEIKDKTVFD